MFAQLLSEEASQARDVGHSAALRIRALELSIEALQRNLGNEPARLFIGTLARMVDWRQLRPSYRSVLEQAGIGQPPSPEDV